MPKPRETSRGSVEGQAQGEIYTDDTGCLITTPGIDTSHFAKVNFYANSRLPSDLPPVKLYIATFPLLCTAAQYSERVYDKPSDKKRETYIEGDWRMGTKAMVIKTVPMDDKNVIVFAIRGTQTFSDWVVNLNSTPTSPVGYLDDPGNLCHSGFLSVARKMVKPVAARLRQLLEENPRRSSCSLLITGHSAGGAVAALIYSHMLATSSETSSELNILTGCFRRIHCVTFGAPPVSLLPLSKPGNPAFKKSLFLSFINEGDPVTRAEKSYARSLLELYVQPIHSTDSVQPRPQKPDAVPTKKNKTAIANTSLLHKFRSTNPKPNTENIVSAPIWPVPPATLCNAGRLVLLRSVPQSDSRKRRKGSRMDDGVQARGITDELLRGVIWGDPASHMMKLYERRIEVLATNAVVCRT